MNVFLGMSLTFLPLLVHASPIDITFGSLMALFLCFPIAMFFTWLILGGVLKNLEKTFASSQNKSNRFWDLGFLAFITSSIFLTALFMIVQLGLDSLTGLLIAFVLVYLAAWLFISMIVRKRLKRHDQTKAKSQKLNDPEL